MLTKIVIIAESIEKAEQTLSIMKKTHPEIRCAEIRIEEKSVATNDAVQINAEAFKELVNTRIIDAAK